MKRQDQIDLQLTSRIKNMYIRTQEKKANEAALKKLIPTSG